MTKLERKTISMIFNQEMVKALIDGRKTVTSTPLKNQPVKNGAFWEFPWGAATSLDYLPIIPYHATQNAAPVKIGDLIWVRETFCFGRIDESDVENQLDRELFIEQTSDDVNVIHKQMAVDLGVKSDEVIWKPSSQMPRLVSRLTLRVVKVKLERVQEITDEGAYREGVISNDVYFESAGNEQLFDCPQCHGWLTYDQPSMLGVVELDCDICDTATKRFGLVWDSIYNNWDENPWVWVIEFEVIHKNVDQVLLEGVNNETKY